MESVMPIVTLVALAICGVLAAITARLLREERRRSAARVAMLEAGVERAPSTLAVPGAAIVEGLQEAQAAGLIGRTPPIPAPAAEPAHPADAVPLRARRDARPPATNAPVAVADLFGASAGPLPSRVPFAGLVVFGAIVLAAALSMVVISNGTGDAASSSAAALAAAEGEPLQLMSLSHARTGQGLTISGIVRNPSDGAARTHLTAVVFLFDRQGSFLTSTRAGLDPVTLAPGQQTPFAVNVPQAASVGRYRVSFRTEAGVVPHVDRRDGAPIHRAES